MGSSRLIKSDRATVHFCAELYQHNQAVSEGHIQMLLSPTEGVEHFLGGFRKTSWRKGHGTHALQNLEDWKG